MKKAIVPILVALVGICFVTYSFLDTFIIEKNARKVNIDSHSSFSFVEIPSSNSSSSSQPASTSSEFSFVDSSNLRNDQYYENLSEAEISALFTDKVVFKEKEHYSDADIYIDITTHRDEEDTTTYYVADIRLRSLKYFKTALAKDTYGENIEERTSDICKRKKGILAINGDTYGAQEGGYVLRNGVMLREDKSKAKSRAKDEDLAIYADGTFEIFNESDYTLQQIAEKGAWQVFSFGPGLVRNGQINVTEKDEVGTALNGNRNQRCAIGIVAPLHYIFFVSDGRTTDSHGFSLYHVANLMKDLHCYNAYNLDGGGSATMYLDDGTGNANGLGHLINIPTQQLNNGFGGRGGGTTSVQQREVSDIVYIGK